MKISLKMCSQDQKYFGFRYRVIFVAFLLISPATSSAPKQDSASSLPELVQCVAIASALIKDPNGFLKYPQNVTFLLGCIQSIPNILEMITHETGESLGAGLLVVSGYLLYESNQLYERAKGLEENLENYGYDFELVEEYYTIINDYIKTDIEPLHWKHGNGNTAKMVRNVETLLKKLTSFFNRLNKLAHDADKDIKQISDDKTRSFGYIVGSAVVGFILLYNVIPEVSIPAGILCVFTVFYNCACLGSLNETRKKIQVLEEAIKKKRAEIDKTRASLEVVKMRADINMQV